MGTLTCGNPGIVSLYRKDCWLIYKPRSATRCSGSQAERIGLCLQHLPRNAANHRDWQAARAHHGGVAERTASKKRDFFRVGAGYMKCPFDPDGLEEWTNLLDGVVQLKGGVGEAVTLKAPLHIRPAHIVADIAVHALGPKRWTGPGRRRTSNLVRQNLISLCVDQMIVPQGA